MEGGAGGGGGTKRRFAPAGPLCAALAACLALAACGGPGPSKVTRRFLAAVQKGDMASLPKYATPETVSTVRTFAA
jgi:hypothetical protein